MTFGDLLCKQSARVLGAGAELSAVSRCDEGELHGNARRLRTVPGGADRAVRWTPRGSGEVEAVHAERTGRSIPPHGESATSTGSSGADGGGGLDRRLAGTADSGRRAATSSTKIV